MTDDPGVRAWFCREVFPLEPALMRYLRRNWRHDSEITDLRQDIYAKVYAAAQGALPSQPKAFLFATARNHLINLARRSQVVSIDYVADLEASTTAADVMTPDRHVTARDELRRVQAGLERLPPRCRQVVTLRRIEGLSIQETAERLSISPQTVEQQMVHGMRALVDFMLGGAGRVRRPSPKAGRKGAVQ